MIDQGHLRNGEIETERETTTKGVHRGVDGRVLVNDTKIVCQALEKRCEMSRLGSRLPGSK